MVIARSLGRRLNVLIPEPVNGGQVGAVVDPLVKLTLNALELVQMAARFRSAAARRSSAQAAGERLVRLKGPR